MALYQKMTKLSEFPGKKRLLFPAAAWGRDDVCSPQAVRSIFSAHLGLRFYFLMAERTDLVSSLSTARHTLKRQGTGKHALKIPPKWQSSTETHVSAIHQIPGH